MSAGEVEKRMYKLIIADDEKIIRMGLKNVVDWEQLGFQVTELFSDGQEIIEHLNYMMPDVILTDIKMNHISGLDVAKYVHEHQIPCKVVLISGYQEFDLAVKGMKYGVKDYLLKPTNVDSITQTFTALKEQLDVTKETREKARAEKERMEEMIPLLEERFFADLVLGGVVDSGQYIKNRINILYPDLEIDNSACFLADIRIRDYQQFMLETWEYSYDQLEVNLGNFLQIYKNSCFFHIVYKAGETIEVVGIHNGKAMPKAEYEASMKELVREMEQSFQFRAEYEIRYLYDSIFDLGRFKEDAGIRSGEGDRRHIEEQKKLLMSNISMGNIVTAQKLFHSILEELEGFSITERNNETVSLLATMNDVIREVNEKLHQSLQPYFNYAALVSMKSLEEIAGYCDRIFDRIKMAEEKKEYYDTNSLITKAKGYIQENIYRDISQEEIADRLFICPAYLSRLFKKQTGENFTQYVTRIKMDKAIELLKDPRYKTYQVSEALGYKTPRYFSRLFRLQTGMNPSEYRGKVLMTGGSADED